MTTLIDKGLPDSEDFYNNLFDCIGSPILIIDPQTAAILEANAAACSFYGYSHADFTKKKILDLAAIPEEEARKRMQKISKGEINCMTSQHRLANGEIRDVDVDLGRGHFGGKRVVIATVHDITKQKFTEDTLRESEERFASIFHSSHDAISIARLDDDVYLDVNEAFCTIFALTREKVIGHTGRELNIAADPGQREQLMSSLRSQGWVTDFESKFRNHSGQAGWLQINCQIVKISGQDCLVIFGKDITERKQAVEELRLFKTIIQTSSESVAISDSDGNLVYINPSHEKLFGRTLEQARNTPYRNFYPQESIEALDQTVAPALARGDSWEGELNAFNANGKLFPLWERADTIRKPDGSLYYAFGLMHDISERKQAEDALQTAHDELELRVQERTQNLKRSNERLDLATAAARMGIWDWDIQKDELFWDSAMYELYGVKPEAFSGAYEALLQGLHPDDRQRNDVLVQRALRGEVDYHTEIRVLWPDGSTHWLQTNGQVYWDDQGIPIRLVGVNYDITERKHLEVVLRESEQKFNTLFQKSAVPTILIKLPEGTVQNMNEASEQMFSFNLQESFGLTPYEIGLDLEADRGQLIAKLLKHEALESLEMQLLKRSGEICTVIVNIIPLLIDRELFAIVTLMDITSRKQAEAQLAETNATLEKALRTKDEFMAAMSHELRTPLTGILGMSELLKMTAASSLNEKQLKYIATIEKSGHRLLGMVSNILEYTQLQSDSLRLESRPCALTEVSKKVLAQIAPVAETKQQHGRSTINPTGIMIQTDEMYLHKLLLLLLDNACKFTPVGGEFGIEIAGRKEAGLVDITVWDTGIGIAEENFPRLFRPFIQLDASLARQYEGMGLGLALVKGLTDMLGGNVTVQSILGKGSRFTVALPWK